MPFPPPRSHLQNRESAGKPQVKGGWDDSATGSEARLLGPSGINLEEWAAFQTEIAAGAIGSLPDVTEPALAGVERWAQFSALLAVRWRHSLLYGFGFYDGPDASPGTVADNIASDLLLQEIPSLSVIYRVRCRFEDGSVEISNPMIVLPTATNPLTPPQDIAYKVPRVRLFEVDEYLFEAQLTLGAYDRAQFAQPMPLIR